MEWAELYQGQDQNQGQVGLGSRLNNCYIAFTCCRWLLLYSIHVLQMVTVIQHSRVVDGYCYIAFTCCRWLLLYSVHVLQMVTVIQRSRVVDGYSYERAAITSWMEKGKTNSPMTNAALASQQLTPNRSLKMIIQRFLNP